MDVDTNLLDRLDRIEMALQEILRQRTVKDFYTTRETAVLLGRAEYTVREWCRHGRVRAQKRPCGRGRYCEWVIPLQEMKRLQNEGILPSEAGKA